MLWWRWGIDQGFLFVNALWWGGIVCGHVLQSLSVTWLLVVTDIMTDRTVNMAGCGSHNQVLCGDTMPIFKGTEQAA